MKKLLLVILFTASQSFASTWSAQGTVATKGKTDVSFTTNVMKDGALDHVYKDSALDQNEVVAKINQHLKQFYDAENVDTSKIGTIIYTPPAAPVDPNPAQTQFLIDWQTYLGMKVLVDNGFKTTGDADYVAQRAKVTTGLLAAYYRLLSIYAR